MSILSGTALYDAIAQTSQGAEVSCAVAFWGKGAEKLIGQCSGRHVRLVCNLKMGGTNPDVIKIMMDSGADIRQNDRLHAKIYIGDKSAIITSANASINGLGLEGRELAGWIESGVEVPRKDALVWFEKEWKQSRQISPQDIETARRIFLERGLFRPSRGTFANFHPAESDFPFLSWDFGSDWDYNDREIKRNLGYVNKQVHKQIELGLDVDHKADLTILHRGQWVLMWPAQVNGLPRQTGAFRWTCSSGVHVPNAFTYKGRQPQGAILAMDPMPPKPFDVKEREFRIAFRNVMSRPDFSILREMSYPGTFYTKSRRLAIWRFWAELKEFYNKTQ